MKIARIATTAAALVVSAMFVVAQLPALPTLPPRLATATPGLTQRYWIAR
jgi:hypothetical protein